MSLRLTMLAILTPLISFIVYFVYQDFNRAQENLFILSNTSETVRETRLINDLVHELQKERGYSAGYVASGGTAFSKQVAQQRLKTENVLEDLDLTSPSQDELMAVQANLQDLQMWRGRIDRLNVSAAQAVDWYTRLISKILGSVALADASVGQSEISNLVVTKALLSQAKEDAALEAAIGAIALGEGFTATTHTDFVGLGANQTEILQSAKSTFGRPGYFEKLQVSEGARDIDDRRKTLANSVYEGGAQLIKADDWLSASLNWVELIYQLEREIDEEIWEMSTALIAEQRSSQLFVLSIVLVAVVASLGIAVFAFELVIYKIQKLVMIMKEFKRGEFDVRVPYIEGRSEINILADSIYRFKQETLANRAAMTKRKEEDEAILNAKHQKVVDLVTQGLRALAKADLTTRFETPLDEEYDTIRQDFNSSTDLLHRVLSELSESVHELTERAEQTAAASEELSNRTLQQDRTLKETGSSLEEISEAVKGDHQTLETASSVAGEARETANASEEIMRSAIVAMDKINESSEQISQFISLIDEISFQTNLLALNAGVEAARAGEFGRGFAVVASEVRALAGRSSEAALDIKKLITQSRTQVREGVYLVGRAGNSLENIFKRIEQVDQTLQNVAQSSKRQAEDLSQVNVAMVTLLNLTEANSVMASESRLVSGTLAGVAHRLAERVSEFRLNDEGRPNTTSQHIPYDTSSRRSVA